MGLTRRPCGDARVLCHPSMTRLVAPGEYAADMRETRGSTALHVVNENKPAAVAEAVMLFCAHRISRAEPQPPAPNRLTDSGHRGPGCAQSDCQSVPARDPGSGRPGSLLTLAPHRSGRAGSAASGSSTDSFATRRRVPAGPGSQAMATAIPKACLASSAIRCRDVETGPNLGVLAVFPSNGATCRCPLPSTGSRGLNSPASAVL